jgi:hypothetical protein
MEPIQVGRRQIMEMTITAITVAAGMLFSVAVGILVEEVIFGEIFRMFFAEPAVARMRAWTKSAQ